MSFTRSSKGIAGNGDDSRVWKREIAQIAIDLWAPPKEVPIFYI
jgi:hypothetical protein